MKSIKKIGFQGKIGAFSYNAGWLQFGKEAHYIGFNNFESLFSSLEKEEIDVAVVPYENSLIGTIYENCDLLARTQLTICGERYLRIEHSLLAPSDCQEIGDLKKVFSHIKALDQCKRFFSEHPWIVPIVHEDTAGAAREVSLMNEKKYAAIAHASCASLYGLRVIKENIEDNKNNTTRFLYISKKPPLEEIDANKTTVLFVLKNQPGTLSKILELIAKKRVNITKIVSRPIPERPFEYTFYLDMVWQEKNEMLELLSQMQKNTEEFRCLGIYRQRDCL